MKAAALLAFLAFATASAFAEIDMQKVEKHIVGCNNVQKQTILALIQTAYEDWAVGCLIDKGLNGNWGHKIRSLVTDYKLTYRCGTDNEYDSKNQTVNFNVPSGAVTNPEKAAGTVFHELLHASDPSDAQLTSVNMHNHGGFPDAVFGCHAACYGRLGWTVPMEWMGILEAASGRTIAPMDWDRCKESSPNLCRTVRQYATLCQQGPFRGLPRDDDDLEIAYCLLQKLKKGACKDRYCAPAARVLSSLPDGVGDEPPQEGLRRLAEFIFKAIDADRGSAPGDIGFMARALVTEGHVSACRADPDSY
jgi:hypothetical protein